MNTIPKKIYQAWHDKKPHPIFVEYINKVLKMNPGYEYELFSEQEMDDFVCENFDGDIVECYQRLNSITAKVDFWRYLILYKRGGIYIDIYSTFLRPLDELIDENDGAIITREPNTPYEYVQWALFFAKNHPILEKTIQNIVYNIKNRLHLNHVGKMTGPLPYTMAIDEVNSLAGCKLDRCDHSLWSMDPAIPQTPDCLFSYNDYRYRIYGIQYGSFALSWVPEKDTMYSASNPHWTVEQRHKCLLKW